MAVLQWKHFLIENSLYYNESTIKYIHFSIFSYNNTKILYNNEKDLNTQWPVDLHINLMIDLNLY
jgi:hypothetical protein